MMRHNKDTILGKIIYLTETLEGSKLEEEALNKTKTELAAICEYLGTDEITAIFFSVIFVLQNQREQPVSLHDIAEFLDYSFLYILEYRKNISSLEEMGLISMMNKKNVSPHPENNGYQINGTVMNNVIDGEPILKLERGDETTERVLGEIQEVQNYYMEGGVMDYFEYKRQILTLEKKYGRNKFIQNALKQFSNDFDSRSFLYYFSVALINGAEACAPHRRYGYCETEAFMLLAPGKRISRKKGMTIDRNDVLIINDYIKAAYLETDEYFHGKKLLNRSFKLTANGIKKLFGPEAKLYLDETKSETELDKTITALSMLSDIYESTGTSKNRKLEQLRKEEEENQELSFFKNIQSAIKNANNRFFLYDCTNDFLSGHKSSLCSTLNDLYSHDDRYFSQLRMFLDEKHPLLTQGFLEIEKNDVIEQTEIGLGDKTIDLLYGNNADLYKKTSASKNVIMPDKLKEKTLFYSDEVQQQIDMLTESFDQKKLESMQARLEQKALPKGIAVLLYGAPGTGKTETVYQLAKKTNRKVLHVDISEAKSMWFGESEKRIKKIFTDYTRLCHECKKHKENTPILLFNEADALISKRKDVSAGNCAQTENAIQNILLEELEKLEGIMIATTNLCENMDAAFERRFLFKIKYDKPSLAARTNIWLSKLPELKNHDAERLAGQFDFSGGEIDNIVRKCQMNEIIKGEKPCYDELVKMCNTERLESRQEHRMGFCGA
ncbi:ATP-binding protein [Treponema bryantii]|uniref:ATP-binding protein n=1 Tax=Treponema bryantii TaxID=163 RepID=UPI0003B3BFF8|nr:ATP-binding protein [Treponema bryantii]